MSHVRMLYVIALLSCSNFSYGRLTNLSVAKCKVETYYESGKYDADTNKVVNKAIKHFAKTACPSEKTVVFDIDDTILSTFKVAKSIHYGHVDEITLAAECGANLPAIPASKRLYNFLVDRGFHIVFITGRTIGEYEATQQNLVKQGFTHFDKILMREQGETRMRAQQYKLGRRQQLAQEGYDIVGSVGDQWSDLCGGYAGHQVKLPNYMYILK